MFRRRTNADQCRGAERLAFLRSGSSRVLPGGPSFGSGRLETSAGVARKAGEKSDESLSIVDCGDAVGRIGRHCLCADHAAYRASEDPDILDPTLARTYVGRIVFASFCDKLFD